MYSAYSARCGVGIAIVEDEKSLVDVYSRILKKKGIEICFVAFDGREAVKKYIECTPKSHVILMDYRMPLMNGIEATREILKQDPDAKVIFFSADISVKEEAMNAGAMTFIKKPANISVVMDAIEKAIGLAAPTL